jgi:hypothetical protein
MIDLYYWQHSDRRLAASMPWWADLVGRYGGTKPGVHSATPPCQPIVRLFDCRPQQH